MNYIEKLNQSVREIMNTAFPDEQREAALECKVTSGDGAYNIKAERHKDGSTDITIE